MKIYVLLSLLLMAISLFAFYDAGELSFTYLNIPVSPISSALSYTCAGAERSGQDIYNPASIYFDKDDIYVSYMNYLQESHLGYFEFNTMNYRIGLKYFNSGAMELRDSLNNYLGDFSSKVIIFNLAQSQKLASDLFIGYGIMMGGEFIDDFFQYAGGTSFGIIKTNIADFLNIGMYAQNIGVSSYEGEYNILPGRIVAGIRINEKDMPIKLNIDAGKIFDSDYFYALGIEFYLIGNAYDYYEKDVKSINNIEITVNDTLKNKELQGLSDESKAEFENTIQKDAILEDSENTNHIEDTEPLDSNNIEITKTINDTIKSDSLNTDSINNILNNDTTTIFSSDSINSNNNEIVENKEEEEFMSYADYLEQEENKEEIVNKSEEDMVEKEEIVNENKKSITSDIRFVIRMGVSSDKNELQMGTSSDLIAGVTGGFGLYYKDYRIDYAAKFSGELGISHSIGIRIAY